MDRTDKELVQATLQGNTSAYGEIIRRYQDAVFGLALSRLGNLADAEDAAQEAFLAAYRKLGDFDLARSLGSWLLGFVRRLSLEALARRRREAQLSAGDGLEALSANQATRSNAEDARELHDRILDMIAGLPSANRDAAILYYINGYSQKEVADFLGVPLGTVKSRLWSSRKKLKEELAMVKKKITRKKPKRAFTNKVLSRVSEVQVFFQPAESTGERIVRVAEGARTTKEPAKPTEIGQLLLSDQRGRCFPIVIGSTEAAATHRYLHEETTPRPLTHDLLLSAIEVLGGRILRGVVTKLEDCVFYGKLVLRQGRSEKELDCRPSDMIALCTKAGAPIFVHAAVIEWCAGCTKKGGYMSPRTYARYAKKGVFPPHTQFGPSLSEKMTVLRELSDADFKKLAEATSKEDWLLAGQAGGDVTLRYIDLLPAPLRKMPVEEHKVANKEGKLVTMRQAKLPVPTIPPTTVSDVESAVERILAKAKELGVVKS